jgi:hypothetical protein
LVDGAGNHIALFLLQLHHSRLDRVFNDKTSYDAWASLTDTMATIRGLPFGRRIPPSAIDVSSEEKFLPDEG